MIDCDIVGSGEPLLLLHGALVRSTMWQPQIDAFCASYRLVACDLPAHGESPDVPGEYTIAALSERVSQQLDSLDIERAHVIGHSLGGMVAQQLAVSRPERIQRLVLAETAFGTRNSTWERLQTAFARPFLRLTPQSMLVDLSVRRYGALHAQVADYLTEEMGRYNHQVSVRVMSAAFGFAGKEQLRDIRSPTLVLVAEQNKQTHAQGKKLAELIPDARFEIIPHSLHMLNMDNPVAFNQVVLAFLRDGD
jgi:pimeloyl-ACP methyl ester carboxylesterase